ncbi:MAG: TetR/AcrR family transcriptional regulator [Hyphomicrobiales bacterium]
MRDGTWSDHDRMRQRMLAAARRLVVRKGISGLSVRRLASELKVSVGTIYYYFRDIDEVMLALNEETLRALLAALEAAAEAAAGRPAALVDAYFDFIAANGKRWHLLFAHFPPRGYPIPESYVAAIESAVARVSAVLVPHLQPLAPEARRDVTVGLWAMLHGLSMLEQQGKLGRIGGESPLRQIAHATVSRALGLEGAAQLSSAQEMS